MDIFGINFSIKQQMNESNTDKTWCPIYREVLYSCFLHPTNSKISANGQGFNRDKKIYKLIIKSVVIKICKIMLNVEISSAKFKTKFTLKH